MPKKLKVPSSARRHIRYEKFSSFVSAARLRHVQRILTNAASAQGKIDGILCIAGIDSRYNEGMSELLHYLLFGFFQSRKKELESSGFPEEVVDDLMILVCPDHVQIYCNPVNYHYLLPYTSHWPGVQFHSLSEDEYTGEEDDDEAEEFKIRSLIAMVSHCSVVGIPYSRRGFKNDFNVMAIEKWPIIQAYALDDFGAGGFFTLKHEVVDVSDQVHCLEYFQDPVSLEILLTEQFPLLERQWNNMLKQVDMAVSTNSSVIPHSKVSEPLSSYFSHGLVSQKGREGKVPFVAFTRDTESATLKKALKGESVKWRDLVVDKKSSVELMICRVSSPHSPISLARTYFFCQPYSLDSDSKSQSNNHTNRVVLRYAISIYLSMVSAVLEGIEEYSQTVSVSKARERVMTSLQEGLQIIGDGQLNSYLSKRSNIELVIEQLDGHNMGQPLEEGKGNAVVMKYISLVLVDVPGPPSDRQPGTLGSLAFAETFLDSRILLEGSSAASADVLCITSCIPRCHLWSMTKSKTVNSNLSLPVDDWGSCLATHSDIEVTPVSTALIPPDKVTMAAWENGLGLSSSHYGSFSLHGSQMQSVALYDGDSMDQVALLLVDVLANEDTLNAIPPHLTQYARQSSQPGVLTFLLAFNPHSKAHTNLYGKILPVWKEKSEVPAVERLEYLDYDVQEVFTYLQQKFATTLAASSLSASPHGSVSLKTMHGNMPNLESFMDHLTSSSGLNAPVQRDVFNCLSGSSFSPEGQTDDKIIVTILTGAPGCEKNTLCSVLTSYNKHLINWLVYKQPEECSVNSNFLHRSMTDAVHVRNESLSKTTRVVLIAPGFCDTADVVRIMFSHPDNKVRTQFSIGAVTLCIDPRNTFMEHKMTLPMLTSQCCQGWVNNILFTSLTQAPSELLDAIQNLIRSINPDVALLKAENGEVKRSTDLDLIMSETAFNEVSKEKARNLMKPYWSLITHRWICHPAMKDVVLKFSHPLEKHLLLIKLRTIKGNMKNHPFEGNIYFVRGFLAFSNSPAIMDFQFTPLSGKLILNSSVADKGQGGDSTRCYVMSFTGIGLEENALKGLLRTCVKQKPEKKPLLTKKDLTEQDIKKIHAANHLEDLPDGWFYNGSHFISMSGERSLTHPSLAQFIAAHVAQKNVEIHKYNAWIDADTYVDLFP